MIRIGYKRSEYDCYVYVKSLGDGSSLFLLLYVDDMMIAAKSMSEVKKLKILLRREFDMKDFGCGQEDYWDGDSQRKSSREIMVISEWLC